MMRWLATLPRRRLVVVECGAGEAELCRFLSEYFKLAIATDVNPPPSVFPVAAKDRISYIKSTAENLPVPSDSVDMVVSMQALHHFDVARHLAEAHRVLTPGGIFAALAWGEIALPGNVKDACQEFIDLAAPFWEPERDWVAAGYPGLAFDGESVELPLASMNKTFGSGDLIRTLKTWSAYRRGKETCPDAFDAALEKLRKLGGSEFEVSWPIVGRIFRKHAILAHGRQI